MKEIKEKIIEILNSIDPIYTVEGLDSFANHILELFEQREKEILEKQFEEHLRVLEESKQMSFEQGWKRGRLDLVEEIEKELHNFRVNCKRLEETNSPIQILDTSKNFFISKIKPLLERSGKNKEKE